MDDAIARSFKHYENKYLAKCSQDRVKRKEVVKEAESFKQ
jgi:hypothetical protein